MRWKRLAIIGSAILTLLPITTSASADDNVTPQHWYDRQVDYRMSDTLPDAWFDQVERAAAEWDNRSRLRFDRGANIAGAPFDNRDSHIVWRGEIPADWQAGCPPDTTLACTRSIFFVDDNHLVDSDFVFNHDQSMGHNDFNCNFLGFATRDVRSIALHEFGHWGDLDHTNDRAAVMFDEYVTCRRLLHDHDIESMRQQYVGH